jgi:uncharacterized membrane protein YfcA
MLGTMTDILVGALVVLVALAASTVAAVAGFGGAVMLLPVLVWAFGVRDAVPTLTIAQLAGNLSRVWFNRTEIELPVVRWFAIGAVPAAVAGGVIFATAPAAALSRLLGVFLLVTVAYRRTPWGERLHVGLRGFLPLGATFGLLSALVGSVGPMMAPFFLSYGLVRGTYIGTEALSTVVMHVTKLSVYGSYALLSGRAVLIGLALGAVMFVGSYLGKAILNRVPERAFPLIIDGVLIAAGILLVLD